MDTAAENNRRLALSTLTLYFRMFFMMGVQLYASRVLLAALGTEDFGLYGVVGGLVMLFAILSASITVAIARFITYELGRGAEGDVGRVFRAAMNVQLVMVAVVAVLAETAGLWFLQTKMVFPPERAWAVHVVYQAAVAGFAFTLLSAPYNAAVIAHERMGVYAAISVGQSLLMLGAALAAGRAGGDRLALYGVLMGGVPAVVLAAYAAYCRRRFAACRLRLGWDRPVVRQIFAYAGWTYIGAGAALLRDQGGNVLINLFHGPAVNAARTLAMQVQAAVNQFATSFTTALNPQITKSFAAGDMGRVRQLVGAGSAAGYFLLLLVVVPLMLHAPYVLQLWLGRVPESTVVFVRLALVFILSEAVSTPLVTAASASSRIRDYQLLVGGIQALNFPLGYALLRAGLPAWTLYVVAIGLSQACLAARLVVVRRMVGLSVRHFVLTCYARILGATAVAAVVPIGLLPYVRPTLASLLLCTAACVAWTAAAVYAVGCTRRQRQLLREKLGAVVRRIKK